VRSGRESNAIHEKDGGNGRGSTTNEHKLETDAVGNSDSLESKNDQETKRTGRVEMTAENEGSTDTKEKKKTG
jgi:hypothetical protein